MEDRFGRSPFRERLIKIIQLRLMATDASINLIREGYSDIRIYSDYTFTEFQLLQKNLKSKLPFKMKWAKNQMKQENSSSVILIDSSYLVNDDKLTLLEEIFNTIKALR